VRDQPPTLAAVGAVGFADYGAVGDGLTDDTAAVQAALDASAARGVIARAARGATYLVKRASALFNGAALVLKDGTRCDLNGATLKLDADQWCSLVVNEHVGGGGSDTVELVNGTLDGNEANQTRVWSAGAWKRAVGGTALAYTPTVCLYNLTAPVFDGLTILNGYIAAAKVQSATAPRLTACGCEDCWGDGWHLSLWTDGHIDELSATDCRTTEHIPAWGSAMGQGLILDGQRLAIGTVRLTNCTGPAKVQGGSTDIVWDKLFCVAGTRTGLPDDDGARGAWWGIKFQGTDPTPHNQRIKVGAIVCDASDAAIDNATQAIGAGVYLYCSEDVEISSYTGIQCGRGDLDPLLDTKDWVDIKVVGSPGLRIGQINTVECHAGALLNQDPGGTIPATGVIRIGELHVRDPQWAYRTGAVTGSKLLYTTDGHLVVGRVRLYESAAPPFATTIASGTAFTAGAGASIHIDEVEQNRALNAVMFEGTPDASIPRMTVGRVRVGDTVGRSCGAETLANGGTTTPVTAEEVTSWSGLYPLLAVQPVNASAAALGSMRGTPNPAPSAGFTIGHGAAGATDYVSWKLLGYASLAALDLPWAWSNLTISTKPTARSGASLVYLNNGTSLLFGGITTAGAYLDETWLYTHATETWTQLSPAHKPSARTRHAMTYDSARGRVVLFGGTDAGGADAETWEYYAGDWTQAAPVASPGAMQFASCGMTFDSARGVCVLYGGGKFWEYDGATWADCGHPLANGATAYTSLCFDPDRAVTVIICGYDGAVFVDGCAEWDGTTLTARTAGISKGDCIMVYDTLRRKMVVTASNGFPGVPANPSVTMERTGTAWATVTPTLAAGRCTAAGVFCPTRAEVLVFGGTTDNAFSGGIQTTSAYRRG
jgi:hypothetical protein